MTQHVFDGRIPWLNGRQKYIGSSDAPAIFGEGYSGESISTVWADKCGFEGKRFTDSDLALMNEGAIGEKYVLEMFANRHPELKVKRKENPFAFYVSSKYPYLCASLDCEAYAGEKMMPVEAKVVRHQGEEWRDGGCPTKYVIQVQHQMLVTETERACVCVLLYGEYQERWIEKDEEFIELAMPLYEKFWQHVLDRTPPPDDSPAAYVCRRIETNFGTAKRLGKRGSDVLRTFFSLREESDKLERKINAVKAELAEFAAGAEYLVMDDQTAVKLGKRSIEKKPRLPKGITIV